jgi:hypothetical protein
VIVPLIASISLIQVSVVTDIMLSVITHIMLSVVTHIMLHVVTHVMLHVWPSCEEGVILTKEIRGSAVYKRIIPNCCSAPYMMTQWEILVSCDVLRFTLPAVFVASEMKVLIYQEHIHYQ